MKLAGQKMRFLYPLARAKHSDIHAATKALSDIYLKAHLAAGADIDARNEGDETPLHIAVKRKDWSKVKYLIKHKADKNAVDSKGDTALHMLMKLPDWNVWDILPTLNLLIKSGANLEIKDDLGNSPFHLAVKESPSCVRHMKYFLSEADVNTYDNLGNTPLHTAAWRGQEMLVRHLINYGADVHAVNHEGKTATDIAQEHQHYDISLLLKQLQAKNPMTASKTLVHQFDRLRVSTNDQSISECTNNNDKVAKRRKGHN